MRSTGRDGNGTVCGRPRNRCRVDRLEQTASPTDIGRPNCHSASDIDYRLVGVGVHNSHFLIMQDYLHLFAHNREWAKAQLEQDATFFDRHAEQQNPGFLFIGCCDSRVPIELLTGAKPGEIFVHRNIANQAHPTDLSMLSALEYAIEVLDVKNILVCGHFDCGGVKAAMGAPGHLVVDHWLEAIRDIHVRHELELNALPDPQSRFNRLVELNVLEQVFQLSRTPIVRHAWARGRRPTIHGIVYDINDGLIKEVVSGVDGDDRARELRKAIAGDMVTVPASLHLAHE